MTWCIFYIFKWHHYSVFFFVIIYVLIDLYSATFFYMVIAKMHFFLPLAIKNSQMRAQKLTISVEVLNFACEFLSWI